MAGGEALPRLTAELDRPRLEPVRIVAVEVAVQRPAAGERHRRLGTRHHDLGPAEIGEAAGVVAVHVGHHERSDGTGVDARIFELRPDLLIRSDPAALARPHERMPPRLVSRVVGTRALARVDDDRALRMLDREGANRKPRRPVAVGEDVGYAEWTGAEARLDMAGLDLHFPGLDWHDPHGRYHINATYVAAYALRTE